MEKRISPGVIGLDQKMQGGFIEGSVNYVTGKTGTGKTAFSASFLHAGMINEEPGIYVTTEEREEDIKGDVKSMFGWDLDDLEAKKLLKFYSIKPTFPSRVITGEDVGKVIKLYIFDLMDKIQETVKKFKARRIVLDSISIIEMFIKDEYLRKVALIQLVHMLKELGVTSLITGTIPEESEALSTTGMIEFIVDSIIKLDFVPVAEGYKRTLTIRKMRRTEHSIKIYPFEIIKEGLKIIEIE